MTPVAPSKGSPDDPDSTSENAERSVLQWLTEFGDDLFSYAVGRVETVQTAEDLVQDTLIAAVQNYSQFQGRAAPKTWLLSILRRKLVDHYRRRSQQPKGSLDDVDRMEYFTRRGKWCASPGRWSAESDALDAHDFWEVFRACLAKLPGPLAEIFVLRVIDEAKSDAICKAFKITATNFAVRMHRARLGLRDCLEKNWFGEA